jgi:hypothetical protein
MEGKYPEVPVMSIYLGTNRTTEERRELTLNQRAVESIAPHPLMFLL